ncbi:hypothetical protein C4588_03020 [Candidatus Parcubacteria bacterium]|nr:MAG: hypothetical protein C4588_03020 [Candidatus Parcubacteria bacterium]
MRSNLGQAEGIALVGVAAANAGVNAYHAVQVSKIQQQQQKKLENDEIAMTYIRNLIYRLETQAIRLARTSTIRPGTPEFEALLQKALKSDMLYKGNCNASIYVPPTTSSKAGDPRSIWGKISRSGFLEQPSTLPPDVGPIWATGCKNALEKAKIAYVDAYKEGKQFEYIKTSKSDIGTLQIFAAFGGGLLLLVVLLTSMKLQTAVIKEQRRKPKTKPKRKRI